MRIQDRKREREREHHFSRKQDFACKEYHIHETNGVRGRVIEYKQACSKKSEINKLEKNSRGPRVNGNGEKSSNKCEFMFP